MTSLHSIAALLFATSLHAAEPLKLRQWDVAGVRREALVHVPARAATNPVPIIFAFHGHGGTMRHAARVFDLHNHWPDALIVYMQGLNTPGQLTDPQGREPGWQKSLGDQNDRDLKFVDAVLTSLAQEYKIDAKRVYATGHSNGGGFTYLLWGTRADKFAAFAPCASAASRALPSLKSPKPVLHIAGENDPLVKFDWQRQTIATVRELNECGVSVPWELEKRCTIYPSKVGAPVVTFIHRGKHVVPSGAPEVIVKFFKEHSLR
jgi:polyhydroxybutyrate depolymerase